MFFEDEIADKLRSYPKGFYVKNHGVDGIFLYNPEGHVIFTSKSIESTNSCYLGHSHYSIKELKAIITFVEEYK